MTDKPDALKLPPERWRGWKRRNHAPNAITLSKAHEGPIIVYNAQSDGLGAWILKDDDPRIVGAVGAWCWRREIERLVDERNSNIPHNPDLYTAIDEKVEGAIEQAALWEAWAERDD